MKNTITRKIQVHKDNLKAFLRKSFKILSSTQDGDITNFIISYKENEL